MDVTIQTGRMKAVIRDQGAELISLQYEGREYLWNGDPAYWSGHAPNLFPFVGRLFEERYTLHGQEYHLGRHGFAKLMKFDVLEQSENAVTFGITDSEETRKVYPYLFDFQITFSLEDTRLFITADVFNRGRKILFFGYGGHPGFRVPIEEGRSFEDYYLEFPEKCFPDQVMMSKDVLVNGTLKPYPLVDGTKIPLHHDLFDNDAIVLTNTPYEVSLKADHAKHSVTVSYPGMPYIGFWHAVHTNAPYVAIEPWVSLPGRQDIVEEFSSLSDLVGVEPDDSYTNTWKITLK